MSIEIFYNHNYFPFSIGIWPGPGKYIFRNKWSPIWIWQHTDG